MKVAITTEGNRVFQHFGKCELFTVYTVEDGQILGKEILDANGSGHSALADLLRLNGIDLLICGGIGQGAKNALSQNGIELICGVEGFIDTVIEQYVAGALLGNPDFVCSHHHGEEHHHDHNCHCTNH